MVLDEGMIPQPLNRTIPKRAVWKALACSKCGGQYYRDGMLPVQGGWVYISFHGNSLLHLARQDGFEFGGSRFHASRAGFFNAVI